MSLPSLWSVCYINAFIFSCLASGFPRIAIAIHHGNETDKIALLTLKAKITDDPFGFLSSWNDSIHFCQWRGVLCGRRHQRVTVLELTSQKLTGPISPYIGNLTFLKELVLDDNTFVNKIPQEIGHLPRLEVLWLGNNSFTGELPANISGCSHLRTADFSGNKLKGTIPEELGSLSKLEEIFMDNNNLTGEIPLSFGNLSILAQLFATSNALFGSIPVLLGKLTNLEVLSIDDNRFSGTIPRAIFNLSSINEFDVSDNQIYGSLPLDLGITLPNLEFFGISGNQFTGSIPSSLSNMTKLAYFIVIDNKLRGNMPNFEKLYKLTELTITSNHLGSGEADDLSFISSLTNATKLEVLALNDNNFGGTLPESFSNLSTKLALLYLDNNQLSGGIPSGLWDLVNLQDIQMWNNHLTGEIPTTIGRLQELQELALSSNKFTGNIPSSLGNLSILTKLLLSDNNFYGSIPSSLGNCQNLLGLNLSRNNLTGAIPRSVFGVVSLSLFLDLSHNQLTDSLPIEVGNLKNLGELDVSLNMLFGEIPSTLSRCIRLEILNMGGNFVRGMIPSSLSSLRGIRIVDLSHNNLSGQIPAYMEEIDLQFLNLSFNDFEGALPTKGIFKNGSAIFVSGNAKLCGGIPELNLPVCKLKGSKKRSLMLTLKLVIPTTLGLTLACLLLFWLRKKRKRPLPNSANSPDYSLLRFSYQSLVKATNGFSSTNLIGVGSFGSVYKGIVGSRMIIAVKVLNLQQRGALRSFEAECEALRNIRHRNLVKVLSACSGVDYQGNDFKAIVYEFMINGSLEEWLHPIPKEDDQQAKRRRLNFLQRLNIAIDIASVLDYLHHHCQTPIVHCDIKPSNILLDDEMTGHVGDFGLTRLLLNRTNNFSSNQTSSIGLKGSIGYTPPGN